MRGRLPPPPIPLIIQNKDGKQMSQSAPLLEMKNIQKDFFGNQVLTDINLTLKENRKSRKPGRLIPKEKRRYRKTRRIIRKANRRNSRRSNERGRRICDVCREPDCSLFCLPLFSSSLRGLPGRRTGTTGSVRNAGGRMIPASAYTADMPGR